MKIQTCFRFFALLFSFDKLTDAMLQKLIVAQLIPKFSASCGNRIRTKTASQPKAAFQMVIPSTSSRPEIPIRWVYLSTWAACRYAWPQDGCSNTPGGPVLKPSSLLWYKGWPAFPDYRCKHIFTSLCSITANLCAFFFFFFARNTKSTEKITFYLFQFLNPYIYPHSRLPLEKLAVAQLGTNSPNVTKTYSSLPSSTFSILSHTNPFNCFSSYLFKTHNATLTFFLQGKR
jgi:hypothetical protein